MADDPDARAQTGSGDSTSSDDTESDDIDAYLDPELDPVSESGSDDSLPGPFSLSQLVRGLHFLSAGLLTPFAWFAYQEGNLPQVASLGLLIALLLVAGVVTGRIAERRFG
jgi:VIT1/CCC1 family predicted Fe2+/Mn2+ transporter